VIKTTGMYAASAFILLEVVDIVTPALSLPSWTVTLVIILLSIGFPITAVLSWIFDITPEGWKRTESVETVLERDTIASPVKRKLKLSDGIIAVLMVVVCILLYPKIFSQDKFEEIRDEDGRISIAVMPFENLTGDTTLNWFQRGISSLISNALGSSSQLAVRDDHTVYEVLESTDRMNTAGISPLRSKEAAKLAHADSYVTGSYQGREGTYWIMANLVNTESGEIIWTKKVEGDLTSSEYLDLANSLCVDIKNYLEIQVLEQETDYDFREAFTSSAEAYRLYTEGMELLIGTNYNRAIEMFKKELEIDSAFTMASFYIAVSYNFKFPQEDRLSKFWVEKAYQIKDNLPLKYQYWIEHWYALYYSKDYQEILNSLTLIEESGVESRFMLFDIALTYWSFLKQYEKAIQLFEKIENINMERGEYWDYADFYLFYSTALHDVGNHEKEHELLNQVLQRYPSPTIIRDVYYFLSICALSRNNETEANGYIEEYLAAKKELGESPDNIEYWLSDVYRQANLLSESEVHMKNARKLSPGNDSYLLSLARLYIDDGIHLKEGMVMARSLSEKYPDSPNVAWAMGRGNYKFGNYEEALLLLRRAFDLRTFFSLELFQEIQEVEKALAGQSN